MYTLGDLLEQLQYGEMYTLPEGGMDNGACNTEAHSPEGVRVEDYPKIISHINFALVNIYTKFAIEERELVIMQMGHVTRYHLHSKHSVFSTDPSITDKYIMDVEHDRFSDDILSISAVYDQCGDPVALNDTEDCSSIFTPAYDQIQIPNPADGAMVYICYRARPTKLDPASTDLTQEIRLPDCLQEALCYYVAGRLHSSRAAGQDLANMYLAKYYNRLTEMGELHLWGTPYDTSTSKLEDNGWV